MPLNIQDDETTPQHPTRGPVLHQPGDGSKGSAKMFITLIIVVVVAGAALFVYESGLLKKNTFAPSPPPEVVTSSPAASRDTVRPLVPPPADTMQLRADSVKSHSETVVDTAVRKTGMRGLSETAKPGDYTIYISRHKIKANADSEAGKWQEAGYETTVSESDGWFRVSIGRYKTWDEAKATAEKLRDGLEAGYKIGRLE